MFGIDPNTIGLIIIGLLTLANTYYSRKTEKNTNSMKDALVLRTGEQAHLAGREEQRKEGEADRAQRNQGRLDEQQLLRSVAAPLQQGSNPLPVVDNRVAIAAEKTATATVRIADEAEKKE